MTVRKSFLIFSLAATLTGVAADYNAEIHNAKDGVILCATISVPDTIAPKAMVVLVSGSGAQNRDEEIVGHKPFKVLSDRLVDVGYGVLRMDDRGVGCSGGDSSKATLNDIAGDVDAAVGYLRALYPDCSVGVLGHSLGGSVAVKLAARSVPDFIVTLAAPACPGDSLVMQQSRALAVALTGKWENEPFQKSLLTVAKSFYTASFARATLYALLNEKYGEMMSISIVQDQVNAQIDALLSESYRDMLRYDPTDDIIAVCVPWMALNGTNDMQVEVANLETIRNLAPSVTTKSIEGHNHLFQESITGLPNEYAGLGQSPSDATIDAIIKWLDQLPK